MKKINNPFKGHEGYFCFGCCPDNHHGLKLDFWLDEENKDIVAKWNPMDYYQGYQNVLHGGVQATILDEIASWAIYVLLETGGVTSKMEIKYVKPVYVNKGVLTIKARVDSQEKRLTNIKTELYNSDNELCAEAMVQYFTYPQELAIKKLNYPGIKAFIG